MKTSIFKRLAALVLCTVLVSGTALAANTVYKTITVEYSGIKLVIDGVQITPKDANGATVEPFIYNGTTYLPVRAVGEALGKQVSWDGSTQTVYLGDDLGQSVFLMDVCPPYQSEGCNDKNDTFSMAGESYTHGFTLRNNGSALINLNGKYQTLAFDMGHEDGWKSSNDGIYEIYLDGQLVQTIRMGGEELVKHITIDLNNALQLKIIGVSGDFSYYGFANITLS